MITFHVWMLDDVAGEVLLVIQADNEEHARVIANLEHPEAMFISVKEAEQ